MDIRPQQAPPCCWKLGDTEKSRFRLCLLMWLAYLGSRLGAGLGVRLCQSRIMQPIHKQSELEGFQLRNAKHLFQATTSAGLTFCSYKQKKRRYNVRLT
jgi:hypothetical protein